MYTSSDPQNTALVAMLVCLSMAGSARANNLLVNPNFDVDSSGWAHGVAGVTHIADAGWPAPGALRFENSTCCTRAASQCVAVSGGASHEFGAALRQGPVAPGQAGDGIGLDVFWYDNADCSHPALPGGEELAPIVDNAWEVHMHVDAIAPETARSALVRIRQYNFAGLADFVSYADSAFFQPTPFGIFADGFEALAE
jgi:hypothetical protein